MKRIFIALFIVLALVSSSFATTYYVSTSGDDSATGSQTDPFLTIQHAVNTISTSDDIVVQAGTYDEVVYISSKSGTADDYILISADGTVHMSRFVISGTSSYIEINGFRMDLLTGSYKAMVNVDVPSNHIVVNNCYFYYDATVTGDITGVDFDAEYCTIKNCTLEGFRYPLIIFGSNSTNCLAEYNVIKNWSHDAFRIFGHDHIVRFNEIKDANNLGITHLDIFQSFNDNLESAYNVLIEYNYCHDNDSQIGNIDNGKVEEVGQTVHDWTFRNNLFVNISQSISMYAPNMYWYNNTFYYSGRNTAGPLLFRYSEDDPDTPDVNEARGVANDCEVLNNIFIGCGTYPNTWTGWYFVYDGVAGFHGDYNYVTGLPSSGYPAKTSGFTEEHGINGGDPKFVDEAGYNFNLQSDSPAIDKGVTISSFSDDYVGVTRPQGAAWDIGAYEYLSGKVYYISWDSGDDTNDGLSKTTPWKHLPGMHGETGNVVSYTPQPGDTFILKGGETWALGLDGASDYTDSISWTLRGSGATGAQITYTVDTTWYTGTSYSKPEIKYGAPPMISLLTPIYISDITKASNAVVTANGHGLSTGDVVSFLDVGGMTEINKEKTRITVLDVNTFSCDDIDSSSYTTYTSGGVCGEIKSSKLLLINDLDYLTFNGIKFGSIGVTGDYFGLVQIYLQSTPSNIVFYDCEFDPYDSYSIYHASGVDNETIKNCSFSNAQKLLAYVYSSPGVNDVTISYNDFEGISDINVCSLTGSSTNPVAIQFVDILNNGDISNLFINNNQMFGDWGSTDNNCVGNLSGFLEITADTSKATALTGPIEIYNNVFNPNFSKGDNDFDVFSIITLNGPMTAKVMNNSFIRGSTNDVYSSVIKITPDEDSGSCIIENNLFFNLSASSLYMFPDQGTSRPDYGMTIDYNIYFDVGNLAYLGGIGYQDWASWTSYDSGKYDQHSYLSNPNLTNNIPQPPSDAIDKGIDLSAYFTTDYDDNTRPQGDAWDIGAYEYTGTTPTVQTAIPRIGASGAPIIDGSAIPQLE